jgi:hypothetical protein
LLRLGHKTKQNAKRAQGYECAMEAHVVLHLRKPPPMGPYWLTDARCFAQVQRAAPPVQARPGNPIARLYSARGFAVSGDETARVTPLRLKTPASTP